MAQIILAGDGLTIEVPDELAKSDEQLKRALTPHYPDLANALVVREEKEGVLKVTVSKRAGPKGSTRPGSAQAANESGLTDEPLAPTQSVSASRPDLRARLAEAPDALNPALALAWQLARSESAETGRSDPSGLRVEDQLALQSVITEALTLGEHETTEIEKTIRLLQAAPAVPACQPVRGF